MGNKYFTVSYDDGLEQDERLTALMRKYGIKGTFNLSGGLFGQKTYIRRAFANVGVPAKKNGKHCVEHFVMPKDKACEIYQGFEIASHGLCHRNESKLTGIDLENEVIGNAERLSELFNQEITGHIFPYGAYNDEVVRIMKKGKLMYGRKATIMKQPKDFSLHQENGIITPTCWHLDSFAEKLLREFLETPCRDEDMVFYMWGHGYELDYGTKRGNWDYIERIFRMVSESEETIKVENRDLFRYCL